MDPSLLLCFSIITMLGIICGSLMYFIELKKDIPRLNENFALLDNSCKNYLEKVTQMPTWRKNLLGAIVSSLMVTVFLTSAYSKCCVSGEGGMSRSQLAAVSMLSVTITSFIVFQSKSSFEHWHVICDATCLPTL